MMDRRELTDRNFSRVLLTVFGLAFLLAAVLYNEILLGLLAQEPPLKPRTVAGIRAAQVVFLLTGLSLVLVSEVLIARIALLDTLSRKAWITNTLLAVLPVGSLLLILELSLRPFAPVAERLTTIYVKDETLGWKLRPNAQGFDVDGGALVKINGKGLRGPELDYVKPPGVIRILYLGDSVTFGYRLADVEQTFPYLCESELERRLGSEIQTINSGVGGYSPWQEYAYLASEGIKYGPDLIVVAFVLNDVTEKFGLVRFGGGGVGWQLQNTVSGPFDRLVKGSSIVFYANQLMAMARFGRNVKEGAAQQETLEVEDLVYDHARPSVQRAWETTLRELDQIYEFGRNNAIPTVLVVFPFAFQFEDPRRLASPQEIVSRHALERSVPVIDLLPLLAERVQGGISPQELFLDEDHLSDEGSKIVAGILADQFESLGVLRAASVSQPSPEAGPSSRRMARH